MRRNIASSCETVSHCKRRSAHTMRTRSSSPECGFSCGRSGLRLRWSVFHKIHKQSSSLRCEQPGDIWAGAQSCSTCCRRHTYGLCWGICASSMRAQFWMLCHIIVQLWAIPVQNLLLLQSNFFLMQFFVQAKCVNKKIDKKGPNPTFYPM